MGQLVLGVIGGAIGAYYGGPSGAVQGFAIGYGVGGAAFPQTVDGPRLQNLQVQTSQYGDMIPIVQGFMRVPGKVIWSAPILETSTQQGGKGGPNVNVYTYEGVFAVVLCEGPISGIRRIWANGILLYDVSDTAVPYTVQYSAINKAAYMTFYYGTPTQNPDPTMQAYLGAANVPAYRNVAYIVFNGLPLAPFGNILPNINVEVYTTAAPTNTLTRVWQNLAVTYPWAPSNYSGDPNTGSGPMVTTVSGSYWVRVANRNPNSGNGTAGQPPPGGNGAVYLFDASSGIQGPNDVQTTWESSVSLGVWAGGQLFSLLGYAQPVVVMTSTSNNWNVVSGYGLGSGPIIGHASGGTGSGNPTLYTANLSNALLYDLIPALTIPAGGGTWNLLGVFPSADTGHLAVLTCLASGGAGTTVTTFYFHILAINATTGAATELSYSPFSAALDTWWRANVSATVSLAGLGWSVDDYGLGFGRGMLESDLTDFWFANISSTAWCTLTGSNLDLAASSATFTSAPIAGSGVAMYSLWADNGYMAFAYSNGITMFSRFSTVPLATTTAAAVIDLVAQRNGLTLGQLNTSLISDTIYGFMMYRQGTGRGGLTPTLTALQIDAVESDQTIKFVKRQAATAAATITLDDMGAGQNERADPSPLKITRGNNQGLPSQIELAYYAVSASYEPGFQYARRLSTPATNPTSVDSASAMSDQQAANQAAAILWDAWAGRTQFDFSTSLKWAQLEPTDVIVINDGAHSYLARIERKVEQGVIVKWTAVGCAPVYNQNVAPGIIQTVQTISSGGLTTLYLLDLPPLRDQDGNTTTLLIYVCEFSTQPSWPGAVLFKSSDGGGTWVQSLATNQNTAGTAGTTTSALTPWAGGNTFDELSTVSVSLLPYGATLASASALSVLNGANVAVIGGEIVQFKNATLVAGTTYALSGFLRGRFGTESAMGTHAAGETFVLLANSSGAQGGLNTLAEGTADIGVPRQYRAVTNGAAVSSAAIKTLTATGNNLLPFAPVYLHIWQVPGSADIGIGWTRRNRISWQWQPFTDIPMSEATEAYIVTIFDGLGNVKRTINVSGLGVETAIYTAAQQTTDFGTTLTSLAFGVQQVSAVVGAGHMATATELVSGGGGGAGDLYYANVSLLVQGTLPAGGTTFIDRSAYAYAITNPSSSWQMYASPSKFGNPSYSGSGSGQLEVTSAAPLVMGASDFTWEGWVYLTSLATYQVLIQKSWEGSGSNGIVILVQPIAGQIQAFASSNGTTWDILSNLQLGTPTLNAWHHFALCRHGSNWFGFLDGAVGSGATSSATVIDGGTFLTVGNNSAGAGTLYPISGYLDQVRITKGVARYTSSFTPPTAPFPTY
jgi:Putative phage tail protein